MMKWAATKDDGYTHHYIAMDAGIFSDNIYHLICQYCGEEYDFVTSTKFTKEISDLRLEVLRHRYKYYVLHEPTISDYLYDSLEKKLKFMVEKYPKEAKAADYVEFCPVTHVGSEFAEDYPFEAKNDEGATPMIDERLV